MSLMALTMSSRKSGFASTPLMLRAHTIGSRVPVAASVAVLQWMVCRLLCIKSRLLQ